MEGEWIWCFHITKLKLHNLVPAMGMMRSTIDAQYDYHSWAKMGKSLGNFITLSEFFSGEHESLDQAG